MKIEVTSRFEKIFPDYCKHFPHGYVKCETNGLCNACVLAERLRREKARSVSYPLFTWRDALPQTPAGKGETWYQKPVILSPAAMNRLGLEINLINQIVFAYDGPGVLKKNVAGEIDVYLLNDRSRKFIVSRCECFGIPSPKAAKYFDECFFLGLSKLLKI